MHVHAAAGSAGAGGVAAVEALQSAARALGADFLAALASATTVVRLLKFSPPAAAGAWQVQPSQSCS